MPAQKPTQPPSFDAGSFAKRLYERVLTPLGQHYTVFGPSHLPRWVRWVQGTSEYDGTGLRDVVNANALYLDQVKEDLDTHKEVDSQRHAQLAARVSALESATPPFPG